MATYRKSQRRTRRGVLRGAPAGGRSRRAVGGAGSRRVAAPPAGAGLAAALLIGAAALSGCALPMPVVIAGYAADGVSVGFTGKTVGDHAVSGILDRDCAVWRVIRGERICVDWQAAPQGEDAELAEGPAEGSSGEGAGRDSSRAEGPAADAPELLFARPEPAAPAATGHVVGGQAYRR